MFVSWEAADRWLRVAAAGDLQVGQPLRCALVVFEEGISTIVGFGPPDGAVTPTRQLIELAALVQAVGAGVFALSLPLPLRVDDDLSVQRLAVPNRLITLRARVRPRRARPTAPPRDAVRARRVHMKGRWWEAVRGDRGEVTWARPCRLSRWRLAALDPITDIATGRDPLCEGMPAAAVVRYLDERGYELAAAKGWRERYLRRA